MAVSFTTAGAGYYVDKIDNTIAGATFFIAWGTGGSGTGSTATITDTALQAEATEARATAGTAQPTAVINRFTGTLTNQKAGGKTVEEVMLTNIATGGVCIVRATHGSVSLATGDSISYTIDVSVS